MLTYSQSTGELRNGELIGVGFSGNGPLRNKPAMQGHRLEGPIPRNDYRFGRPYKWRTGWLIRLIPERPDTREQKYYLKAGGASRGCLCVPEEAVTRVRALIDRGETELRVTD